MRQHTKVGLRVCCKDLQLHISRAIVFLLFAPFIFLLLLSFVFPSDSISFSRLDCALQKQQTTSRAARAAEHNLCGGGAGRKAQLQWNWLSSFFCFSFRFDFFLPIRLRSPETANHISRSAGGAQPVWERRQQGGATCVGAQPER